MMPATPATTSAADSAILATIAAVKAPPTVTSAARPTIAPSAALPVAMELDPPPQRQLQRATETSRRRGARSRAPRRDWRDDEQSTVRSLADGPRPTSFGDQSMLVFPFLFAVWELYFGNLVESGVLSEGGISRLSSRRAYCSSPLRRTAPWSTRCASRPGCRR
jgi:hypothetical protein